MNRLQKKCLFATAGFHLLLLVILLVGPAFFQPKPVIDTSPTMTGIASDKIEQILNSGSHAIQPPTPVVPPPVQPPQPTPPPQQAQVQPPPPVPKPSVIDEIKQLFKPEPAKPEPKLSPDDLAPKKETKPKEPHKVEISLTEVHKTIKPKTADDSEAKADAQERKRLQKERLQALRDAARSIQDNTSSAMRIEMPGNSSASFASYGQIVKSVYDGAWTAPDNAANDEANTRVKVVISRDGTVVSADIITPSGDAEVDKSVQHTLDRVRTIGQPFPDGSTDETRTYIINFNLKAKRMSG